MSAIRTIVRTVGTFGGIQGGDVGRSQRTKGHAWEREVARDLKRLDPGAKRNLEYQEGEGVDIDCVLPFAIQCKCGKRPPWFQAVEEARPNAEAHQKMPLAAVKIDRVGKYAVMDWGAFLALMVLVQNTTEKLAALIILADPSDPKEAIH